MDKRIKKTIDGLVRNRMEVYYSENCTEALEILKKLLKKGDRVSVGGSVTLQQTGAAELLKNGDYEFLDRSAKGLTPDGVREVYGKAYLGDAFLCSANAVTENGELYNVDGNGNRVSQIAFGSSSVIVLAGVNKIVKDLNEAVIRVKTIAAPKNALRLGVESYCSKKGHCYSIDEGCGVDMCAGCNSEARLCSHYLVSGYQRNENRIKVILINEELGY